MPAKSKAQQQAMAIALHEPSKLYARNQGLAEMSKSDLRDFAETSSKGLPAKKGKGVKGNTFFETKLLSEENCAAMRLRR